MHHHPQLLQDAESSTRPPEFSGDESTWSDWSFKLRSFVSVVDFPTWMDDEDSRASSTRKCLDRVNL